MSLQKAVINQVKNEMKSRWMEVQFNPANYTLSRAAHYEESIAPGKSATDGSVQYTGNDFYDLQMELVFDSSRDKEDVRKWTKKLMVFIEKGKEKADAYDFNFSWGVFSFTGVVESIHNSFTLFHSDGTPLRARVELQAKGVVDDGTIYGTKEHALNRRISTLKGMDQLCHLAYAQYNDASRWVEIARLNQIANPRKIMDVISLQLK